MKAVARSKICGQKSMRARIIYPGFFGAKEAGDYLGPDTKRDGLILFGFFFKVEGRGQDLRNYVTYPQSSLNQFSSGDQESCVVCSSHQVSF